MANLSFMQASTLVSLLNSVNTAQNLFVVLKDDQLALGFDPLRPKFLINFSDEIVHTISAPIESSTEISSLSMKAVNGKILGSKLDVFKVSRRGGECSFTYEDIIKTFTSQKALLKAALVFLEEKSPGTLRKLSKIKSRARRIIARDREHLFDNKKLVEDYSELLMDGWWVGVNNSGDTVKVWLRQACICAGISWDDDFKVNL